MKQLFRTTFPVLVLMATASVARAADCTTGSCACGDTVPAGADVVFDGTEAILSGTCALSPALTVLSKAKLDLNGGSITCDGGPGHGIDLQGEKSVLENGSVVSCEHGVVVGGTGGHKINGIVSTGNLRDGFHVSSDKNKLTNNTADGNADNGFLVADTALKNQFRQNTATANANNGFEVVGSTKLKENVSVGNLRGFYILSSPDKASFADNIASGNNDDGFRLFGGDRHKLTGNTAVGNGDDGFVLFGDDNKLSKNIATDNAGRGVRLSGTGSTLAKNIATSNVGAGLSFTGSQKLTGNRANNNGGDGITATAGATLSTLKKNVALQNGGFDMSDVTAACGSNTWSGNIFETSSPAPGGCIE